VHINLTDASVHVTPPSLPSLAVLVLSRLDLRTDLIPDQPFTLASVSLHNARVLLVDDAAALTAAEPTASTIGQYWQVRLNVYASRGVSCDTYTIGGCTHTQSQGYVSVVHLETLLFSLRLGNGLVLPDFEVRCSRTSATGVLDGED
jgi:hypothetical protein